MKRARARFVIAFAISLSLPLLPRAFAAEPAPGHARALVLGGGGPVGVGWETGLLAGLASKGADLTNADMIIGTSAGSIVGAEIGLGRSPAAMLAVERARAKRASETAKSKKTASAPPPDLRPLIAKFREMALGERPPDQVRKEIGDFALKAHTTMTPEQFAAIFERIIPAKQWPSRPFECTTVDTATGKLQVWNKSSGVPLARAVASSCAVPGIYPPVEINGRRYMDGGVYSPTNGQLAKGFKTVVIVDVTAPARTAPGPKRRAGILEREENALREAGSNVIAITPDAASHRAFGPNLMDASHRAAAAQAGFAEGQAEAARIAAAWNR
jgi:NTE family protein